MPIYIYASEVTEGREEWGNVDKDRTFRRLYIHILVLLPSVSSYLHKR